MMDNKLVDRLLSCARKGRSLIGFLGLVGASKTTMLRVIEACDDGATTIMTLQGQVADLEAKNKRLNALAADTSVGWDHRYRRLEEGEVILASDECKTDKDWCKDDGRTAGQPAPDPNYTSHRVYRRLKPAADTGQAVGFCAPETIEMLRSGKAVGAASISCMRGNVYTVPLYAHPAPLDAERVREDDLVIVAKSILERGYISESVEEERGDYLALRAALRQKEGEA